MADPADIQRLVGDLAREGSIASVDLSTGMARVRFADDLTTGDIPWLCGRAGKTRIWAPPAIGEQVTVLCPEGDTGRGMIIGSLSSDAHPHAAQDGSTRIDFEDGSWFGYDPGSGDLTATIVGKATITAPGGIRLVGPVTMKGDVKLEGDMTATGDVVADGKSLKGHTHTAVQPGSGFSGPPK
ncbi:phage baseplate assembly protein V [Sphingomonas sp. Leaf38]|uniref:phage baseplate assembly protein V n=1 Tax=Sphingomonas sp. Leaf38 TaxID=1736217 RepID=UPI0006FAD7DD|nr:phage baseplate assembly protein V [Sphingomonas sp. Leaf38]KQN29699.1 baseplate assembly protein [Sphingomonas sp. Leaf38]